MNDYWISEETEKHDARIVRKNEIRLKYAVKIIHMAIFYYQCTTRNEEPFRTDITYALSKMVD